MKPLIQLCLFLLVFCTPYTHASTLITVTQTVHNKSPITLQYEQAPRLVQIIQDSLVNSHSIAMTTQPEAIYWLGAALYDYSSESAFQQKKRNVLNALKTQYTDMGKPEHIQSLQSLSAWIENQQFLKREFIPLDYDSIRLKAALNPLINGSYLLTLPTKPKDVTILGAVTQNGSQPFEQRQHANEYLDNAMPLSDSNNSFAWLIQPDGTLHQYPIAYWNKQHIDIAPGAIIYLEFQGVKENEQALNQQILALLKHWIR
ncbi:capsule biosynthesis GfcC family protein [Shewanella phaeophyticola]|uniref:Capsule biosynthesis GfcC family protein n=1 Tax=Shewanella phaeophyticola TaxID=2978345 RepID=A0ABT2P6W0_9GAMM|nr:capsule biosynthesis GfcC family protein [Shewanella sp. KJ10-1]MCT8988398.1 capsule biosynthesis GfcC family protein [Shewanella sp. KJ10-1]